MLELPYKEMELETSNKKMGASTGRCAVRDCSTHAEGEVFIKASPQGLGIHAGKEGEGWLQEPEVMVDAMKTAFQTYQAWCTYELTETMAACTRPAQDQARSSSALGEKCTRGLSPNQKNICNWYLLAEEKLVSPSGVSLGILARQGPCPGGVGQHKTDSMLFL